MEGEKFNIFGGTYIHYPKRVKLPDFQPRLVDLKAINRNYW
jgi:hypothetical protein